jgi:hypothetical protein
MTVVRCCDGTSWSSRAGSATGIVVGVANTMRRVLPGDVHQIAASTAKLTVALYAGNMIEELKPGATNTANKLAPPSTIHMAAVSVPGSLTTFTIVTTIAGISTAMRSGSTIG